MEANVGYKNILHIWFYKFYINRDTSVLELFHVVVFQQKRFSKPSLKLLDCGRKIQNDVHIDTYYRQTELISWRLINITVFHMRFLPPTDQKCAESSTYWQFFYYRPPGKIRFTHLEEIAKMLCQELDIYIYIWIYMTLLIIDMDFLYQFNLGLIAPLFMKILKKECFFKFSKVGRSVIGWRSG